jgi:hypothetical protein
MRYDKPSVALSAPAVTYVTGAKGSGACGDANVAPSSTGAYEVDE